MGLPGGSESKASPCSAGDLGLIPGSGRSPGEEMATHSSILAWKTPGTEEPGGLKSMELHRVRHDRTTLLWTDGLNCSPAFYFLHLKPLWIFDSVSNICTGTKNILLITSWDLWSLKPKIRGRHWGYPRPGLVADLLIAVPQNLGKGSNSPVCPGLPSWCMTSPLIGVSEVLFVCFVFTASW